ncbi:hypothetical protein FG05_35320 [Fusarium graminearum]|nr:hypothetical protein FG05_35320 [Fusarium graminearum]
MSLIHVFKSYLIGCFFAPLKEHEQLEVFRLSHCPDLKRQRA